MSNNKSNIWKTILQAVKKQKHWDKIFLFLITFTVYVHNLSPSVYGGDSGDFIAAALTKGVPHPSGYPLYTILGILSLKLPIVATPAWKFGLVSATLSAGTILLFYLTILTYTKNKFISLTSSLLLAFSYPFWLYAEVVEVFSLHNFFIVLLVYLTLKLRDTKSLNSLYFLVFFAGLSLTNNLTILLLFPVIGIVIIKSGYKHWKQPGVLLKCSTLFLLSLLPYIYIPLAAAKEPLINWGYTVNLENFLYVVLRRQYGWGITATESASYKLSILPYLNYWKAYANPIIIVFIILGVIFLITKRKYKNIIFFTIIFLLLGPLFLLYANRKPIYTLGKLGTQERFFMQSIIVSYFFVPYGIIFLKKLTIKQPLKKHLAKTVKFFFHISLFIIVLAIFASNYKRTNLRNIYIGSLYAKDILRSIPPNGVLLIQDDSSTMNSLVVQLSEKYRSDIYIPGMYDSFHNLLGNLGLNEKEIVDYKKKYHGLIEKNDFYQMLLKTVDKDKMYSNFIFPNIRFANKDKGEVIYIPYGLVFKLTYESDFEVSEEEYLSEVEVIFKNFNTIGSGNSFLLSENLIFSDIQLRYSRAYYNTGKFIMEYYKNKEAALPYLGKAAELYPLK